jgi:hypothetical protein
VRLAIRGRKSLLLAIPRQKLGAANRKIIIDACLIRLDDDLSRTNKNLLTFHEVVKKH